LTTLLSRTTPAVDTSIEAISHQHGCATVRATLGGGALVLVRDKLFELRPDGSALDHDSGRIYPREEVHQYGCQA